jgi:lysyl-tRNA synthetase class 2
VSTRHNPEFTLLELYMAYATYEDLITLTEELIRAVDGRVRERFPKLTEKRAFTLSEPFARATMRETIARGLAHTGEGRTKWSDVLAPDAVGDESAVEEAFTKMLAVKVAPEDRKLIVKARTYGDRIAALFEIVADPLLPQLYRSKDGSLALPVFVTEHPVEVSPLARRSDSDPRFVDRFELFLEHRELANAFSELNDPDDQAERFRAQLDNKARGDDEAMDFDHDYIRALQHGMPPTAGLGIGIDRFVMALCGQPSIRDVLLFPLLKPEPRDAD